MAAIVIPEAKLRGLRRALAENDGKVQFKNGATVEIAICKHCDGRGSTPLPVHPLIKEDSRPCLACGKEGRVLRVSRGYGGHLDFSFEGMHRAYHYALHGYPSKRLPSSDPSKYGDDPPFSRCGQS